MTCCEFNPAVYVAGSDIALPDDPSNAASSFIQRGTGIGSPTQLAFPYPYVRRIAMNADIVRGRKVKFSGSRGRRVRPCTDKFIDYTGVITFIACTQTPQERYVKPGCEYRFGLFPVEPSNHNDQANQVQADMDNSPHWLVDGRAEPANIVYEDSNNNGTELTFNIDITDYLTPDYTAGAGLTTPAQFPVPTAAGFHC